MRKFIISLLVLIMTLLIFPAMSSNSFAEDSVVDVKCLKIDESAESCAITGFKDGTPDSAKEGKLDIPDTLAGKKVTGIGESAFKGCSALTSITIPNSVTSIGNEAFYFCEGLTSITIPNSVKTIGYNAFYGCNNLTCAIYIGTESELNTLKTNISDVDNEKLTDNLHHLFNIDDGVITTTTQSTLLSGDFVIPDTLDKIKVTGIGYEAFYGCNNLTSVSIPDSVTSIGTYAFKECSGLTSVSIPNKVTSIGNGAFGMCSNLKSVSIPDSVENIGGMAFACCSSLKSVTIPGSVKTIGDRVFSDCQNFIYLGTEDNWKKIEGYKNVSSLDNIYFKDKENHIWTRWYIFKKPTTTKKGKRCRLCIDCNKVESETIPKLT